MSTLYHWHRGAIGCCPSATQCSAAVVGERLFGSRVSVPVPSAMVSPASGRFQFKGRCSYGSSPRWRQRSRENNNSLGKIVCQSAIAPYCADLESYPNSSQVFSSFPLLPLAAIAVAFSRATSLMATLSSQVQRRLSEEVQTRESVARTRNAPLVEEFVEAAKGSRPWRPGLQKALTQQGGISLALLSATAIAHDHLNPVITTLRANPTFMSGLIAWAIAQVAKVFTYYMVMRKWDFRMVMGSGGMPSSHSALCFALTTSVAIVHGVSDALFPVCLGFTLIVMYDAAGVRRHAGRQAEVLNMIVEDLFQGHPISEKKLKELLGHTPLQVFVGASLGIIVGYLCSRPSLT